MTSTDLQFDVIIAGGGFAGVYCARSLARELGCEARHRVALIASENFMVFQPMLAEVVGSALPPRHVVNPLRLLCEGVTVLRGDISRIDLKARELEVHAGDFTGAKTASFGHLVLTLGGIVDLSRVPGMPEHAYLIKNVGDALKLRGAILDRFEEANFETDSESRKSLLTFLVVGGGYSGVETAGQILDLANDILRFYPRIGRDRPRVILVHSGACLMPEISESLGRFTEENLKSRGVEVILNARVTAVTASRATLNDGRIFSTHTVLSTVGNAPSPLLVGLARTENLATEKGRIITAPTLRVPGQDRLWAAGDCAAVPMPEKKREGDRMGGTTPLGPSPFKPQPYCPGTAQFAVRQGTLLGKNLGRELRNQKADEPFRFTGLGELAAIGHHTAVAEILGCKFHGFIAWWIWRTVYLLKLPGFERKIRVALDWTLDLFFPRDITLLQSSPTQLLKEMHLEKGDDLFHAGDPAQSLYVVKSGCIDLIGEDGAVLRKVTAGAQIGKQTLLASKQWRFSARVSEPTTLVAVSGKVFEAVINAGCTVDEVFSKPSAEAAPALQAGSI